MKNCFWTMLVAIGMVMVGCGGDSGTSAKNDESSSSVEEESSSSLDDGSSSISSGVTNGSSAAALSSSAEEGSSASSSSVEEDDSSSSSSAESSSSVASSSSAESSSSVVKPLISYTTVCPAGKTCTYAPTEQLNPEITYGELLDTRDYRVYKTVTIGSQTWMAQNLNYAYTGVKYSSLGWHSDSTSWCYENKQENCDKYGRLYIWAAAIDSIALAREGQTCGYGVDCGKLYSRVLAKSPIQGVCPSGWHLPNDEEWYALFSAIGGSASASKALMAVSGDGNGTDSFGFSALAAGIRSYDGDYYSSGDGTYLWSAAQRSSYRKYAYSAIMGYTSEKAIVDAIDKANGASVRCVMNDDNASVVASSSSVVSSSSAESFSSSAAQSSSSEKSSSSVKDGSEYDAASQTLRDLRDDKVYKTVTIGNQTWMAENLNYAYTSVKFSYTIYNGQLDRYVDYTSDSTSWCYDNIPENCDKYGRLYSWSAAMDSVGEFSATSVGCGNSKICRPRGTNRGICPEGWHMPTETEWETLFASVETSTANLKLKSSTGWEHGNGMDDYGFSVYPSGSRDYTGGFGHSGLDAFVWSATEGDNAYDYALIMNFQWSYDKVNVRLHYKKDGASIRCVKND